MKVKLTTGQLPAHNINLAPGSVIDVPAYTAERLVVEGHASFVGEDPRAKTRPQASPKQAVPGVEVETATRQPDETRSDAPPTSPAANLQGMTKKELAAHAQSKGITLDPESMNKDAMIAAIEAA